jgi:CSLREA domain-containing protein
MRGRLALTTLLALVIVPAGLARAATITVNTRSDELKAGDGLCSLREAISAVDGIGSGDCGAAGIASNTIVLGAGHYLLEIPGVGEDANATGDLDVTGPTSTLAITGAGSEATVIDATAAGDRVLDIHVGAPGVTLSGLSITGGRAPAGSNGSPGSGGNGGGGTAGESGGGIRSQVALSLIDAGVIGNRAGDGGAGGAGGTSSGIGPSGGNGAPGGLGGGIYAGAALTLTNSTVAGDVAGSGGDGGAGGMGGLSGSGAGGSGGSPGSGGGIYSVGSLRVTASTVRGNRAGNGGGGGNGAFGTLGGAGGPGADNGGDGGGIFSSGSFELLDSTIAANSAGNGGSGGDGGNGGFGGAHFGGGAGGSGAAGGWGGGLSSVEGALVLLNSTIIANRAGDAGNGGKGGSDTEGAGGTGGGGGNGEVGGDGGGLRRSQAGSAVLMNVTVAENAAGLGGTGGAGGTPGSGKAPGANGVNGSGGVGGGVFETAAATTISNSIIASNLSGNCTGTVLDGGHDISFAGSGCPPTFAGGDPKLGPLQFNGGPTQTMALGPGSAAIDQIPASGAGCPETDQRGVTRPRPAGGACDIGAFELAPPSCQPVAATTLTGQAVLVQLSCAEPAAAALSYAIDQGPAHGSLGSIDQSGARVLYTPSSGYSGADSFTYHATSINGVTATVTARIAVGGRSGGRPVRVAARSEVLSPSTFRAARHGPSASAAKRRYGTRVTYVLNRAASVRFTVMQAQPGRTGAGARCVRPTRANRHGHRCTRLVALRGSFTRAGRAGQNRFHFSGRVAGRKLARGRYLLIATPRLAGIPGGSARASFRIVR